MNRILEHVLEYLIILGISLGISFGISWGLVEAWVMFFEYGWIWNELTVPPLVIWDIFFSNIHVIIIMASILTTIIFCLILWYRSS